MVALTGASSKLSAKVRRLAADLGTPHRRRQAQPIRQRQVQRRLTAEQIEQLVTEYQAGASMKELATRWSMHRTSVAARLRQAGVELRRQGIPADQLAEAVRMYIDGSSCQRLAELYECDDETVRQALKRAGVRMRRPWERA